MSEEGPSPETQLRDYWRCFHCDFATTDRAEAQAHFGDRDDAEEFKPICKWWQMMSEDERVKTLQDTIQQLNDAQGDGVAWPVRVEDFRKQHNGVFGIELFFGHDGHNVCRFKSYYHKLAEGESGRSMQEAVERCVEAFEKWRESMNKTVNVEELSKQRMVPGVFRQIPPALKSIVDPEMPEGRIDLIDSNGRRPAITNLATPAASVVPYCICCQSTNVTLCQNSIARWVQCNNERCGMSHHVSMHPELAQFFETPVWGAKS